jgi:hypothetical protein
MSFFRFIFIAFQIVRYSVITVFVLRFYKYFSFILKLEPTQLIYLLVFIFIIYLLSFIKNSIALYYYDK